MFKISIQVGYKIKRISVEYIPVNDRVERFKLYGNNTITVESNRPFLRKKGLKHRALTYRLIDGTIRFNSSLDAFTDQINEYFNKSIPVKFNYQGKEVNGMITKIREAGSDGVVYFLEVENRCWGKLLKNEIGWKWNSNTHPSIDENVDYLTNIISLIPKAEY